MDQKWVSSSSYQVLSSASAVASNNPISCQVVAEQPFLQQYGQESFIVITSAPVDVVQMSDSKVMAAEISQNPPSGSATQFTIDAQINGLGYDNFTFRVTDGTNVAFCETAISSYPAPAVPPPVVTAPTCTLSAQPSTIQAGQTSNLVLVPSGTVTSVTFNGDPSSQLQATYTLAVNPSVNITYYAYVHGPGGSNSCSATVTIAPPPPPPNRVLAVQLVSGAMDGDGALTLGINGQWNWTSLDSSWPAILNTGHWVITTASQTYQVPFNLAYGVSYTGQLPGDWSGVHSVQVTVTNITYANSNRNPTGVSYNNQSNSSAVTLIDGPGGRGGAIGFNMSVNLGL